MKWRPDNWKNPYPDDIMAYTRFENMADQILELLSDSGFPIKTAPGYYEDEHTLLMMCHRLSEKAGLRGWIVFISDDKSWEDFGLHPGDVFVS